MPILKFVQDLKEQICLFNFTHDALATTMEAFTNLCGFVGHGGALVESKPFNQRVVGSNPTLAAT